MKKKILWISLIVLLSALLVIVLIARFVPAKERGEQVTAEAAAPSIPAMRESFTASSPRGLPGPSGWTYFFAGSVSSSTEYSFSIEAGYPAGQYTFYFCFPQAYIQYVSEVSYQIYGTSPSSGTIALSTFSTKQSFSVTQSAAFGFKFSLKFNVSFMAWSISCYTGGHSSTVINFLQNNFVTIFNASYYYGNSNGYSTGYTEGNSAGQTSGYNSGFTAGKQEGTTEGYNSGFTAGKQEGITEGTETGYQNGYNTGYAEGEEAGEAAGRQTGYQAGKLAGEQIGYNNGFTAGKAEGKEEGIAEGTETGYNNGFAAGKEEGIAEGTETGYQNGHAAGVQTGYQNGFTAGKQQGITEGTEAGYQDGFSEGKQQGITEGTQTGYQNGFTAGKQQGITEGTEAGYQNGFTAGKEEGITEGTATGYQNGYTVGYAEGKALNYDQGYEAGKTDGTQEGYDQGYTTGSSDGLEKAQYGIFVGATISGILKYSNGSNEVSVTVSAEAAPLTYSGVDFDIFRKKYAVYASDDSYTLEQANLTIMLLQPFTYGNSSTPLQFFGGDVYDITLISTNGTRYAGEFDRTSAENAIAVFADSTIEGAQIVSMEIGFGRASDTLQSSLVCRNGTYQAGYDRGYNYGKEVGSNEGFDRGFERGKEVGYQNGVGAGIGDVTGINGVTAMLSKVFSIFEVKIFGWFSLGDIVGIALIFGIVFFVLKLVRG